MHNILAIQSHISRTINNMLAATAVIKSVEAIIAVEHSIAGNIADTTTTAIAAIITINTSMNMLQD